MLLPLALASTLPAAAEAKSRAKAARVEPPPAPTMQSELRRQAEPDLVGFYAARGYRPLWITPDGALDPAAAALGALIATAPLDQVEPSSLPTAELTGVLAGFAADPSPAGRARAELVLSRAFAAYVRAMRQVPAAAMTYEHASLRPAVPSRADALWYAGAAPSLYGYVREMGWMHPLYAQLRQAIPAEGADQPAIRAAVLDNLARLRALPPAAKGRTILVDAASARLWMYEDGRPVDSMKVVVGKPTHQTPMLAGYIRHAILNPYWNVPSDLVPNRIAPNVVRRGVGYLKSQGYEVLADWTLDAAPLDPSKVDWRAVAKGTQELRVRQLPNAVNAMGKVKFEFPNPMGIYLHDTPDKNLMREELRQFSSGCVRVEDADRLGRWLLQAPLPLEGAGREQRVDLPAIVPIYITYLTAHPEGGTVALGPDPYKRDAPVRTALAPPSDPTATLK